MRLAYLTSRYPAPSHAFIQREVLALRELGVEIETFALRRAAPHEVLSAADRGEHERTYAIQPVRPARVLADHIAAFVRAPARYLATLAAALGLSTGGLRTTLWQLFYFAEGIHLAAELRRRGIDHLHVHLGNAGAEVAMHAARYGAPRLRWSLTLHGSAEFDDVHRLHLAAKLGSAQRVACVSDWVRAQAMMRLAPEHWDRLEVVRLGIDTQAWTPPQQRRSADGRLRILTIGRLEAVKAQALLVEAVARLRADGVDAELTLAGEGPERARLEAAAAGAGLGDHVRLPGVVSQDEIRALYGQADVFCLPSVRESFGVVLLEAQAMEVPVVATRTGGVPEVVDDGRTGILVAAGSAAELADALARLAADPTLRERLGTAGRELVRSRYELSAAARAKRDFLAQLVQPQPPRP